VRLAEDGVEAPALFQEAPPDAVVPDWTLPLPEGIEV
jgi:hypothetical protein